MLRIRETDCAGHHGLELVADGIRMILVTSSGPRIAWFGFEAGENLLYWDDRETARHGPRRLHGGHRLRMTRPGADDDVEPGEVDGSGCSIERTDDGVSAVAPPNEHGIARALTVRVQAGRWTIAHQLRNTGNLPWSGGACALTSTRPVAQTCYRIPLGGDTATILVPLRWGGTHSSRLDDRQFTFTQDALVVLPMRDEAKRMVLAPYGLVEMEDARGVLRKTSPFELDARYPLDTNLAVYIAPQATMVELETMSPQRTLRPGEALEHVETWTLEDR